jgi:hypothetical protein
LKLRVIDCSLRINKEPPQVTLKESRWRLRNASKVTHYKETTPLSQLTDSHLQLIEVHDAETPGGGHS